MKEHFQPEAGNEILKEFLLKLTHMSIAVPLLCVASKRELLYMLLHQDFIKRI
ncbi:hypothetical protein [uncultured Nostoc sp.]|uniref:hypothetical protein n=1 Tax=uncultured Nostoc sp. TaxID=340711 RepID=UPI0035C9CDD6